MSGRRAVRPPQGAQIDVTRGGVTFSLGHDAVVCKRCEARLVYRGNGQALQQFFSQHTHAATVAAAPPPRDIDQLATRLRALGGDELEVVAEVVAGLERGRPVYGELAIDTDRRDPDREALDEVRDGLVYAAIAAIRRRRRAGVIA